MSVILEEWRTGAPPASFLDAGRKLAGYRLGPRGRMRMVRRLLEDLDGDERRRILEELSGR